MKKVYTVIECSSFPLVKPKTFSSFEKAINYITSFNNEIIRIRIEYDRQNVWIEKKNVSDFVWAKNLVNKKDIDKKVFITWTNGKKTGGERQFYIKTIEVY